MRFLIAATRDLLAGPPAYQARSPWSPLLAVASTVAVLAAATLVATALVNALGLVPQPMRLPRGVTPPRDEATVWAMATWLLTMQVTVITLVVGLASFFGVRRTEVLALDQPFSGRYLAAAVLLMLGLQVAYNALVLPFAHETLLEDARPFLEPLRSDAAWLFAIAICLGAPLSEEILFRGFLLSALARSRIGYFGGALVTTLGWTALHAGYSGLGLIEVFLAGLFFSWLLWRTGNLLVPIFCHALYNSLVLIALLVAAPA